MSGQKKSEFEAGTHEPATTHEAKQHTTMAQNEQMTLEIGIGEAVTWYGNYGKIVAVVPANMAPEQLPSVQNYEGRLNFDPTVIRRKESYLVELDRPAHSKAKPVLCRPHNKTLLNTKPLMFDEVNHSPEMDAKNSAAAAALPTEGHFKLGDGVSAELMIPDYFDKDALREPPYRVYRMDNRGQRWYYRILDDGRAEFYLSVTSLCAQTLPTPKQLTDWIASLGTEAARKYSEIKAHYGTLLHKLCGRLVINKEIDLDGIDTEVAIYSMDKGLEYDDVKRWPDELRKDVLAFGKFLIDVDFKPLAVEVVLTHPDGYAGAIDLVGEMNIEVKGFFGEVYKSGAKAGQPKETTEILRVVAIVDVKSGKKGFYESHEVQLRAYREMWNETFPDRPVTHTFNWAPSEWRSEPSYKLKDQTNTPSAEKWPHLVSLAGIIRASRERTALQIDGTLSLSEGIDKNFRVVQLDQLIQKEEPACLAG